MVMVKSVYVLVMTELTE